MTASIRSEWGRSHWLLVAALAVFGAAVLPPVLLLVNEPTLIASYPVLYVWALLWGIIGTGLLYLVTRGGYFGIDADEVPPELTDADSSLAADQRQNTSGTAAGGEN